MTDLITQPHLILAALDEATRYPDTPVHQGNGLRNEGDGEARTVARNHMGDSHQDELRTPDVLPQMGAALRRWIAGGPTHLVDDHGRHYEHGYAERQAVIRRILDGDYDTITSLLDNALRRATANYQAASGR
ncbi:hypothetical protein ACIQI8_27180 [Streptomyces sp. NPDC092369]|uniref:hypothetical protein n=1 Tax=Streptomyces sp. NPDC092369 TaxID=3366015 RepID=UPI003823C063